VSGLTAGSSKWYSYNWSIPGTASGGTYTYWAIVYRGSVAISPWSSGQNFTVSGGAFSAQVLSLWPVSGATAGGSATLWAEVRNSGASTLPSDAYVWFYVSGPGWVGSHWVGSKSVSGLTPGSSNWYSYNWSIPGTASGGTYTYWAIVYRGSVAISDWSSSQNFTVSGSAGGFNSQFNGDMTGWVVHSGPWQIESSQWLTTQGLTSSSSSVSYNANFANFDYQVRMWRDGSEGAANRIMVRGTPNPLDSGNWWYHGYIFQYTRNGYYSVWKVTSGHDVALQSWTLSADINQGSDWNLLRVVASGSNLYFYINGTQVWSGTDTDLASGRAGIGMFSDNPSTDKLWVDWATLTEGAPDVTDTVSDEQRALNEEANRNPIRGDKNRIIR
jgi:hypothetical protein